MKRGRLAAASAAVLILLTGCGSGSTAPGESRIDVDTPKLQQLKADAGIEPCVPGRGSSDLPDLTLPCLGGGSDVDLSSLSGPLLVNVWNSACGPCRKEMPALQEFYEKHGDQVGVVGLDMEDTYPEAALSLAEMTGATYPQLADPGGDLYDQRGLKLAQGFPQFLLVDADGSISYAIGGLDSVGDVEDLVREKLGVTL